MVGKHEETCEHISISYNINKCCYACNAMTEDHSSISDNSLLSNSSPCASVTLETSEMAESAELEECPLS